MERRLTAILAADVVGFSRLMGANEVGTLQRHQAELIEPEVAGRQGRIVKLTGDGILVEFPSVSSPVDPGIFATLTHPRRTAHHRARHQPMHLRDRFVGKAGDDHRLVAIQTIQPRPHDRGGIG